MVKQHSFHVTPVQNVVIHVVTTSAKHSREAIIYVEDRNAKTSVVMERITTDATWTPEANRAQHDAAELKASFHHGIMDCACFECQVQIAVDGLSCAIEDEELHRRERERQSERYLFETSMLLQYGH